MKAHEAWKTIQDWREVVATSNGNIPSFDGIYFQYKLVKRGTTDLSWEGDGMRSGGNQRFDSMEYAVFHRVDEQVQEVEGFSFEIKNEKTLDDRTHIDWFAQNKSVTEGSVVLLPAFYVMKDYDRLTTKQYQSRLVVEEHTQKKNLQSLARLEATGIYVPMTDPDGYPMKFKLSLDDPFKVPPLEFSTWEDYESSLS